VDRKPVGLPRYPCLDFPFAVSAGGLLDRGAACEITRMKKSALAARIVFICVAVAGAAADLATKAVFFDPRVAANGANPQHTVVRDFFYIRSAANPGGVFGLLAGNTWTLIGMAALALFAVALMLAKIDGKQWWTHIALGLVLGGALGNLYDRVFYLYVGADGLRQDVVRDFLDFRFGSLQYPIFNGADVFICVGAVMIFLRVLFGGPMWGKAELGKKADKVKAAAR
jgi:signal peptidase II